MSAPHAPVVFVVDDDASVLTSLTRLLTGAGFEVEPFAESVAPVLEIVAALGHYNRRTLSRNAHVG
jgi:FixJ family two-component response regulator